MRVRSLIIAIFLTMLGVARCAVAGDWNLVNADFQSRSVNLTALDDKGVHVVGADGAGADVGFGDFLQLQRDLPDKPREDTFTLYLDGGDCLGGQPVSITGEQLTWTGGAFGQMVVPLRHVAAVSRAPLTVGTLEARKEDQVLLANGDTIKGILAGLDAGKLQVQTPAADTPAAVNLDAVQTIYFASTPQPATASGRLFRLYLTDGSALTVASLTIQHGLAEIAGPGFATRNIDLTAVRCIEQVNGPVSWLSARAPSRQQQVSFSPDQHWPARMDLSVQGKSIVFANRVYAHGIGVHANSTLVWPLDGAFKTFRTQYVVDPSGSASFADVDVRILLDDKVVYAQAHIRAGRLSAPVVIPLRSARTLTLQVTAAGPADTQDRVNWIEAALIR